MSGTLTLTKGLQPTVIHMGRESQPIVIVDNLLDDPQSFVDYACRDVVFEPVFEDANFYPGIRAPLPKGYAELVFRALQPLLCRTFELPASARVRVSCRAFSLVTLAPKELNLAQRLPHFDTANSRQLAMLHYLCDARHGGTNFYRHQETGYESISEERVKIFLSILQKQLREEGQPSAQYVKGDTPLFTRTGGVDARFNRLVIYRSQIFHSGAIAEDFDFDSNPATGRLTANAFLRFE